MSAASPPLVIGRYTLLAEIAIGGMASIFLGRLSTPIGVSRTVAIKRIHPRLAQDAEAMNMLRDEARVAMRIRHPNVVATLDVEVLGSELLIVMDYCDGPSLAQLLQRAALGPDAVVAIVSGALRGLHAAHEARDEHGRPLGVVHRDVSPQNILVGSDGVARVIDFGIAKAEGRLQATRQGQAKGKLEYMAPEQRDGAGVDRRSDVFSSGVVLWEALTGRRLFAEANEALMLAKISRGMVPPPSSFVAGLDRRLDAICARALQRRPEDRYPDAQAMAAELEACGPLPAAGVASLVQRAWGEELRARREIEKQVAQGTPVRPPEPEIREGTVLGRRYRVLERLGEGGMGVVYAAVQVDLGRRVAIKVLQADSVTPDGLARFRQEALAAAALGHPNIVQVTDFQTNAGEPPFLVMELLEGESLHELLAREPVLPVERAVFIAAQILAALGAAHAAGIIHRDVKPGNVFVTRTSAVEDLVKVLDFGIAKVQTHGDVSPRSARGAVIGTPEYMAPEQARGLAVDARADLYAVGACLFEMLSGRKPVRDAPMSLAPIVPWVDPGLCAAVDRALAPNPDDRPASALEMLREIASFSRQPLPTDTLVSEQADPKLFAARARPPRRRLGVFALGFGVLVAGALSVLLVRAARRTAPPTTPSPVAPTPAPAPAPTLVRHFVFDVHPGQLVGDGTEDFACFVSEVVLATSETYLTVGVVDGRTLALAWQAKRIDPKVMPVLALATDRIAVKTKDHEVTVLDASGRELGAVDTAQVVYRMCASPAARDEVWMELAGAKQARVDVRTMTLVPSSAPPPGCRTAQGNDTTALGQYARRQSRVTSAGMRTVLADGDLGVATYGADNGEEVVEGYDLRSSKLLWSRRDPRAQVSHHVLDVFGDDAFVQDADWVERVNIRTGAAAWRVGLPPAAQRLDGVVMGASRVYFRKVGVVVVVDGASGAILGVIDTM